MILARWRIIKTDYGKEPEVAVTLTRLGFETFLPVVLRTYPARKLKAAKVSEIILIPGTIFVLAELSDTMFVMTMIQHVTGFERDDEGFPDSIPAPQMEAFRLAHSQWLTEARERLALGKSIIGRGRKPKWRNAREALSELLHDMERKEAA